MGCMASTPTTGLDSDEPARYGGTGHNSYHGGSATHAGGGGGGYGGYSGYGGDGGGGGGDGGGGGGG